MKTVLAELEERAKRAEQERDQAREALRKIGNYTAAHDDVIDASWVAKVVDEGGA